MYAQHEDLPFRGVLDAYVLGEDKYEARLLEQRGDRYVKPATRWEWSCEDFAISEPRGKEDAEQGERRQLVMKAEAAERKARAKAQVGGTKSDTSGPICTAEGCSENICAHS
jgi:hypothetical protein